MTLRRRTAVVLLSLGLPGLVALQATAEPVAAADPAVAAPAAAEPGIARLRPKDGKPKATITRTKHGIPHIVADDWESLGFGEGFATAETSICNLADTVLTGRGERSKFLGADKRYRDHVTLDATNLQSDTLFRDIRNRNVVKKLLNDPVAGPGQQTRALVRGYAAGVNRYIRSVGGAKGIKDPACRGAAWIRPNATAMDLWHGIYAANLLASAGVFVPQIADASPPTLDDPGLPDVGARTPSKKELLTRLGRDPDAPFGSNATAVGADATTTGRGMVLGNPHFPWRGRYRFTQFHLTIPGTYDVAGAGLIGAPVVNIGWNKHVAWSHTVSTAYRFTPYEYKLVPGSPTTYLSGAGTKELVDRTVPVEVRGDNGKVTTVEQHVYRTDEGYVLDAPDVLMPWSSASVYALRDANGEHLRTLDTFLEMGKATSVETLLEAQDAGAGMPWVNTIAADRSGSVLYADHSVVPNVPDDLVEACITPTGQITRELAGLPILDGTRAEGECAWRTDEDAQRPGIFGPANLPATVRSDWVVNANDSYWLPNPAEPLEGYAAIIGCEQCERTLRTRMVYKYVLDRLAGTDGLAGHDLVSPKTLAATEHENRVFGAELAREDDALNSVCTAAGGGDSCAVLAAWDGRSDVDSVGTHIFQEFWSRAQDVSGLWLEPFDAADPVNTPRGLNAANPLVVQAMSDALAYLEERGIAADTPWGELQVAGDDGAPPIAVGGGEGYAGNANALSSRWPASNKGRLIPVSYGSSHIEAISFTDRGRLKARTILTYGQSMNRTSRFSHDQTRLFGKERWVRFPWTGRQIRKATLRKYVVSGGS